MMICRSLSNQMALLPSADRGWLVLFCHKLLSHKKAARPGRAGAASQPGGAAWSRPGRNRNFGRTEL